MHQLGANVVRIDQSAFNATVTDCLRAFGEQDLYVLASLGQLQPSNLNNEPEWTTTLRDMLARNLDELQKYDNLLGLYISDRADRIQWSDANAAVLKAVIAGLKAYRNAMRYRHLPIGVFKPEVSELSFVNYTDNSATVTPNLLPAYSTLSSQWATLASSGTQAASYTPTATRQACPTSATDWALDERAGTDIPTLGLLGLTTAIPPAAKDTGTSDNSSRAEKANFAAIIGGVVGGLVGFILILITFFWLRRRKGAVTPAAPAGTDPWSDKKFDDPSDRIPMIQDPDHHELEVFMPRRNSVRRTLLRDVR
ncbi:1,3-beta-glucanosyltransferase gas1 [Didymella keratinophila]|nr:1,3-beta-glucanosyltransferase gas1 [Didymella keratinophila]